jgi:hypothetical protein
MEFQSEERFFYCLHESIKQAVVHIREAKQLLLVDARKDERSNHQHRVRSYGGDSDSQNPSQHNRQNSLLSPLQRRMSMLVRHESQANIVGSRDYKALTRQLKNTLVFDADEDAGSGCSLGKHDAHQIVFCNTHSLEDETSVAGSGGAEDGDYSLIRSVMRLIQLLVEGHNLSIQEYVHMQPDNLKTFDLVRDVVDYLHAIVPVISEQNLPLVTQVFDTIIDLAQVSFFAVIRHNSLCGFNNPS